MRSWPLWPAILAIAVVLVTWNAKPLRERGVHIRTKELDFVPSPILGRMLCLGQCGAASKLTWIDSFAYSELQMDKHDDKLQGSHESGFQRLYNLLVAEDPDYQKFYEHAAFNIAALEQRHDIALGFQLRGILQMPHNPWLWQQAAVELMLSYNYEQTHPELFDQFLDQWANAMEDPQQRRQVWDWKAAMDRRRHLGLTQLAYWQQQLAFFPPDSSEARYVQDAMREELARFGVDELARLLTLHQSMLSVPAFTLSDALDLRLIQDRYPHGPPAFGPITLVGGLPQLRSDPYGYPYLLHEGAVVSPGLRAHALRTQIIALREQLKKAHPGTVRSVAEAQAAMTLPWLPPQAHWTIEDGELSVTWDAPSAAPWSFSSKATLER